MALLEGLAGDSVACLYIGCSERMAHKMWCKFPLTTPDDGGIVALRSAEVRSSREVPASGSDGPLGHDERGVSRRVDHASHRVAGHVAAESRGMPPSGREGVAWSAV